MLKETIYNRLKKFKNNSKMFAYIDDVFLCSNSLSEHMEICLEYFKICADLNLCLPPEKMRVCSSHRFSVLGFVVEDKKTKLTNNYETTILKMTPESINSLRSYQSLFGICSWLSQSNPFILDSFSKLRHIVKIDDKGETTVVWDETAKKALAAIKINMHKTMKKHSIQTEPSPKGPFARALIIQTDASMTAGGYIVLQAQDDTWTRNSEKVEMGKNKKVRWKKYDVKKENLQLVDFGVKFFPKNWSGRSISEKEAWTLTYVLNLYRNFLISDKFAKIIRVDNSTLLQVLRGSIRSTIHASILNLLSDQSKFTYFDHVTDSKMFIPDGLSRLFNNKGYDIPQNETFLEFLTKRFEKLENEGELVRFPRNREPGKKDKKAISWKINKIILGNIETHSRLTSDFTNNHTINFLKHSKILNDCECSLQKSKMIMRNIAYKTSTNQKSREKIDEIKEQQRIFVEERTKSNEQLRKSLDTTQEVIDVDEYIRNREMQKLSTEFEEGKTDPISVFDIEDAEKHKKLVEAENVEAGRDDKILAPTESNFTKNYKEFTKNEKKFTMERKLTENKQDSPEKQFIMENTPKSLLEMHESLGLHRSVHECKLKFNLNKEQVAKLSEIIKNCGVCSHYKYRNAEMVHPQQLPSTLIPAIPMSMYSGDIFEMPATEKDEAGSYRYFLGIVELTSSFIWCYPMRTKTADECKANLRLFIAHAGAGGGLLNFDADSSISSEKVKSFLKDLNFNVRIYSKSGSTAAESLIGALVKRRLSVVEKPWNEALCSVVAEINTQKRVSLLNFSAYNLLFSKEVDTHFMNGTLKTTAPNMRQIPIDYQALQRARHDMRLYNFNRKNVNIGTRVHARNKDIWETSKVYVVHQMDVNGVMLRLYSIDAKLVSKSEATRWSINRKWSEIRPIG